MPDRASATLDRFFEHYYRRRPVSATFTGLHEYDRLLPDWSLEGLASQNAEMKALEGELSSELHTLAAIANPILRVDLELARDYLYIQRAENESGHGPRRNPSLWTGEAVMSVASIMLRDFAPISARTADATARLRAIPRFLDDAMHVLPGRPIPPSWSAKALRECEGGAILFSSGVDKWAASARNARVSDGLKEAAAEARKALLAFAEWLRHDATSDDVPVHCGGDMYDLYLERGHHHHTRRSELLRLARELFAEERARFHMMAKKVAGSTAEAQERIASDQPEPADYLATFQRIWDESRAIAVEHDLVSWPDWPIRYVPYPPWIEEAAPYLYLLHYRSPAPFDSYDVHDYVVPRVPESDAASFLRAWNHSVIKLNHVVHHGAIGHHVQNWHAYHRGQSRVGRVSAVDCANRIGMFCGGTMAEGWACYVTQLMDEVGYLTPLEQLSEQHTRVRFLARAIVDMSLHDGIFSLADGIRFYTDEVGMGSDAAKGEAVRNSMYPCAAIMYWLGTQGILELREAMQRHRGADWSLRAFHDELLDYGAIPVPMISRLMSGTFEPTITPA